ncbi:MAG: hypothetical protein NDI69_05435 [Bacteriovoracaceae bacterium]|nr:hypothetical protein [Bacteriovoracaceae bacterium]
MKKLLVLVLAISLNAFAHDEGHGPKLTDSPKQGGVLTSVVLAKDASKGTKADLLHKAELVRSADGTVKVYYYDKSMNPLKVGTLANSAKAILITQKKGKVTTQEFDLKFVEDHFEGKSPKPARKPYNIDVKVKEGEKELLAAFDNLD